MILVVDDDARIRFGIRDFLESSGYEVEEADSCQAAVEIFQTAQPDAAIIDYLLADGNALELLPRLKETYPEIPLLILTAYGSIDLAVQAVKKGADQFLTKPVELPALLVMLQLLLEEQRNRRKQTFSKSRQAHADIDPFLGSSAVIRQLADDARKVLASESPILIRGETGTGKGVLAKWLHDHSSRAEEAFVDLNCAGLSLEFLETELFGHAKGAFTGAMTSKTGLFEVAHGGTVFLDEIGDMDLQIQPKLLKVLEEKQFRRLGEIRDQRVDIRLIAATHQDLNRLTQEKKFRSDLHFRINTLPLVVPPLRERGEDILVLARSLLQTLAAELGRGARTLSPDAERALRTYLWPGNIRELRNVLERAVLLSDQQVLGRKELWFDSSLGTESAADNTDLSLRELERQHIQRILHKEQGHVESAAKRLDIPRSTLYQKIKQYQITLPKP
jgi:DNA-binding NtrC family response regulator